MPRRPSAARIAEQAASGERRATRLVEHGAAASTTDSSDGHRAQAAPVAVFDNVSVTYPDGTEALRGVTATVEAGSYVCVIGGNGSGKSTFAQLFNALIVPTGGSARIFGIDTADENRLLDIRSRAAMVFQHPDDQMVTSIVADDIAFGPENLALPQPEIARRVEESLRAVGLSDLAQADPADLSGGQKQRVAIAGAFALRPDLLILDEPAAMLDVRGRRGIRRVCRELNELGITIVHVTHFMDDVLEADRVLVLNQGRLVLDGAPAEVFSHEHEVRELNLDLPLSLQLCEELEKRGLTVPHLADDDQLAAALAAAAPRARTSPAPDPRSHKAAAADRSSRAPLDAQAAIEFENVSFSYAAPAAKRRRGLLTRLRPKRAPQSPSPSGPWALRNVSLSLKPGTLTALIGHTGAGKSTVIELACALKMPTNGSVRVGGILTTDLERRRELRRAIGYVSQSPERQLFAETVYDDVAFGPRNLHLGEAEVKQRVREALATVRLDLAAIGGRSPFSLSGGQQRGVALAGVLALRPQILVLDEPMAGLDPAGRKRTVELLDRLRSQGTTILLVTHSMDDAAALADSVLVLDHGALALEGTPEEIFSQEEELHRIGLGAPGPTLLADKIRAAGLGLAGMPLTLPALADGVASVLAPRKEGDARGAAR